MTTPQHIHALRLRLDALMGCKSAIDEKIKAELATVTHNEHTIVTEYDVDAVVSMHLCFHALKMAKAWLGNALAELGEATPYTVADTAAAIPPTADVAPPFALPDGDLLAMTNALRAEVKAVYDAIAEMRTWFYNDGLLFAALTQAWVYAREASNHLGFLLAAMREYAVSSQTDGAQPAANDKETATHPQPLPRGE